MSLDEKMNNGCKRCVSKDSRDYNPNNGLCNATKSVIDNLPVRCVGDWGKHKISFLTRYVDIVGKAMKGKWELNYIEICSGPGRCISRTSGEEFDGTPLAVLTTEGTKNYSNLLFIDYDVEVINSLRKRVDSSFCISTELKKKVHIFQGDYTRPDELVSKIKEYTSPQSLNIVFVDPTDLSVPWETINKLSHIPGKVDFIINEAIFTDFNRNSLIPYKIEDSKVETKWERSLGIPGFFKGDEYLKIAQTGDCAALRKLFHTRYIEQLKKIEYNYCLEKNISGFYYLLFASKNQIAEKFWKQACLKDGYGQKEFDFGE